MDESGLLVSNFVKEVRIPFTDICDVTENRWLNIHPVTIHLRRPSPFGERIVFMPHMRLFGWSSHTVVRELRALAKI